MHRRSQRGFTLIELMVVLAIITILTITLATSGGSTGPTTPGRAADQITGVIQLARLRAEARHQTHRITVTTTAITVAEAMNGTSPYTSFANVTTTPTYSDFESLTIPGGVVLWGCDTTATNTLTGGPAQNANLPYTMYILPDGQSTGGTIYLTDEATSSKHRVIVFKTTGTALARENW